MLNIKIDHPLKPFSHVFNTKVVIPHTEYVATIAPCLLKLDSFACERHLEIKIFVEGPIQEFTVESELLKGKVVVFMQTKRGYLRYLVFREKGDLVMHIEKTPEHGVRIECNQLDKTYFKGEQIAITSLEAFEEDPNFEQISFGCYKAQDVDLMQRRKNPKEFLPLILTLAKIVPLIAPSCKMAGCFELLPGIHKERDPKKLDEHLISIYLAAFEGIFCPRSNDTDYQGLTSSISEENPLCLLPLLKETILECFCRFEGGHLSLLSLLPHSLDAGKITRLKVPFGLIDMEWSKRKVKSIILSVEKSFSFYLSCTQGLKSCRVRSKNDTRGKIHNLSEEMHVTEGMGYFFDKFAK